MQKRILLRTAKKLGSFFGSIFFIIGGIFSSGWAGKYFFDDPFIGQGIFIAAGGISVCAYFAYKDAKYEVEHENQQLIQELTKHG